MSQSSRIPPTPKLGSISLPDDDNKIFGGSRRRLSSLLGKARTPKIGSARPRSNTATNQPKIGSARPRSNSASMNQLNGVENGSAPDYTVVTGVSAESTDDNQQYDLDGGLEYALEAHPNANDGRTDVNSAHLRYTLEDDLQSNHAPHGSKHVDDQPDVLSEPAPEPASKNAPDFDAAAAAAVSTEIQRTQVNEGGDTVVDGTKQGLLSLYLKDIDGEIIHLSLPLEYCVSWQTFRKWLMGHDIRALPHVKADEFVLRLKGQSPNNFVRENNWDDWISPFRNGAQLQVHGTLCMVRNSCGCPSELELAEDPIGLSCPTCHMPVLLVDEVEERLDTVVEGIKQQEEKRETKEDGKEQTPGKEKPLNMLPDSQPIPVLPTKENSVLRRRKPGPKPEDAAGLQSDEDNDSDALKKASPPQRRWRGIQVPDSGQLVVAVGGRFSAAHKFIIAPHFVHNEAWDPTKLEEYLNDYKGGTICNVNAGMAGFAVAVLAIPAIPTYGFAQFFVILGLMFALFGLVYSLSLGLCGGFSREIWIPAFLSHPEVMYRSLSSWNPSTMMSLPRAWLAWAIVNLVFAAIAAIAQGFQYVRSSLHNYSTPNTTATNTTDPSVSNSSAASSSPTTSTAADLIQLTVFTVVLAWSLIYVGLIHLEVRRIGGRRMPLSTFGQV